MIADDVVIGPNCTLTGKVTLDAGVHLIANVYIQGPVHIGARTRIYPNACIGFEPQDVKFKPGMPTAGVKVGSDCLLREGVTLHAASKLDHPTTVGDRCFLMVNAHLGHDARIGNDVTLVNGTLLAGHSQVGDRVTFGGGSALHQFNRVGRLAMVSGVTALSSDLPPFCMAAGRNSMVGLNIIGLRRNGFSREDITTIRRAFREALKPSLQRQECVAILRELGKGCAPVMEMAEFVATCQRTIVPFRSMGRETGGEED